MTIDDYSIELTIDDNLFNVIDSSYIIEKMSYALNSDLNDRGERSRGESFLRALERHITCLLEKYAYSKGENLRYLGKLGIAFIDLDFDRHKIIKHLASRGEAI